MTAPTAPHYRHELDGLRAIAVLAVLGYHAGYNDLAGGFMGVDVFLVLSGYLITQQIGAALSEGRFHPGRFWLRRVRRLLPAMLPVLAFALVSALLLKGQGAFEEFTGHFLSAGFFYSNYQFLSEADYFARSSDTNLLLHTWSLSLEWQFYLITPLVLMAVHRFGRAVMLAVLLGLVVASLALSEALIASGRSSWAFFGVLPRYWEFAAGGVVALLPSGLTRVHLAGTLARTGGLGLILWAIFGYDHGTFPGFGALQAVAGTVLILLAPIQPRDPVRWLLERRFMLWVGVRSYAIYLIHWPLMVTAASANADRPESIMTIALLISLLLGHLIYRHVETPVRTGGRFHSSTTILRHGGAALATIALISVLLAMIPATALRSALPLSEIRNAATEIDVARTSYMALMDRIHANEIGAIRPCSYDSLSSPEDMLACLTDPSVPENAILLIGDSHGRDVVTALTRAFPNQTFVMMHQSACIPADYIRGNSRCFEGLPEIIADLAEAGRLPRVVLASRWWQGEHLHVQQTLTALDQAQAEVVIVGPGPTFGTPMEGFATEAGFGGTSLRDLPGLGPDRFAFDVAMVNAELHGISTAAGVAYFDRYALFCPNDICPIFGGPDNTFLYFDDQHLSLAGMDMLAEAFAADPALRALLATR